MTGAIKWYSRSMNYGWIRCEGVDADVFFPRTQLPRDMRKFGDGFEGCPVEFMLDMRDRGNPRAENIYLETRALALEWSCRRGPS